MVVFHSYVTVYQRVAGKIRKKTWAIFEQTRDKTGIYSELVETPRDRMREVTLG